MIQGGHLELVEMLIRLGVPMDQPLRQGMSWTPMMYAQASLQPGARRIEQRLCELGVEPADVRSLAESVTFKTQQTLSLRTYRSDMPDSLIVFWS